MARYIQRVQNGAGERWVGWNIQGFEGDLDGYISTENFTSRELKLLGVQKFKSVTPQEILSGGPNLPLARQPMSRAKKSP